MNTELTAKEKRQKVWWETLDILTGAAFPFMILLVFSSTIIMFADYSDETVRLFATIGGECMLIIAYVIFGRQNGLTAYKKFVAGAKKRELNSSDKKSIYKTGEYALWKGFVIGFITTIPYIIIQSVNLASPNVFTEFCLKYFCGWAYYPFKYLPVPEAVNFVFIIFPVGIHAVAYYFGKVQGEKEQKLLEETNVIKSKKHK